MASYTINKNISSSNSFEGITLDMEKQAEQIFKMLDKDEQVNDEQVNDEQVNDEQVKDTPILGFNDGFTIVKSNKVATSLSLTDFPSLGKELTKSQKSVIDIKNKDSRDDGITSSKKQSELDTRSASFEAMSDKEKVASSLTRTKACKLVTDPFLNPKVGEKPKFGVCTRPVCSFAHSEEEMKVPTCGFDGNCRFVNGKVDFTTKKKIPNTKCRFRHSFETVKEWLIRSGVERDPLPETSDESRKPYVQRQTQPKVNDSIKPRVQIKIPIKPKVNDSLGCVVKDNLLPRLEQVKDPTVDIKSPVRKSRWDEKPKDMVDKVNKYYSSMIPVSQTIKILQEMSNSSDDSSSSDDFSSSDDSSSSDYSEYETKRHKRSNRKSNKRSGDNKKEQVIRVPTNELAEIAIKAAFERGQYNIRVIVE